MEKARPDGSRAEPPLTLLARPPARPGPPHSQHDPRDGDADRHAALLEGGGDEAAEGQRRHHAQREGEEGVGAGQYGVHCPAGPHSSLHARQPRFLPPSRPRLLQEARGKGKKQQQQARGAGRRAGGSRGAPLRRGREKGA